MSLDQYLENRDRLIEAGAYDPADERDACGIGLIADIHGRARRATVEIAIKALKAVWHRGAVDADGKTGDGAGIRLGIAQEFFKDAVKRTGHAPADKPIGVGMVFLPRTDFAAQERARTLVETEIIRSRLELYGWRQVPIDPSCLGEKASRPAPRSSKSCLPTRSGAIPKLLSASSIWSAAGSKPRREPKPCRAFTSGSLSARDVIYKGLFLAGAIDQFYPDLAYPRFTSNFAMFHQRYSTNTFPDLAAGPALPHAGP